MKRHIESVQEKDKYQCNQCEYKTEAQGPLNNHVESVHEKVKQDCNLCEYKDAENLEYSTLLPIRLVQSMFDNQMLLSSVLIPLTFDCVFMLGIRVLYGLNNQNIILKICIKVF